MNHNSIETTKRYIRGNGKENRKKAADIMGNIINKGTQKTEGLFETVDETDEEELDAIVDLEEEEEE